MEQLTDEQRENLSFSKFIKLKILRNMVDGPSGWVHGALCQ